MMKCFHKFRSRRLSAALKSILALALCAAVTAVPVTASAAAAAPACDEAYYGTLDYYGALTEGGVVKSYRLNGASSVTDYGTYDEVVNMTDDTAASVGGGKVTFDLSGESTLPATFFFEGKTAQPYQDLPWTIGISYRLNGADASAEDLAGKTGLVEINVDINPNPSASDYYRNNLVLAGVAAFNADDIVSLEAEGAQVQLLGNLRTVMFLALPGETQHISIRVGSDSFSSDGLTFIAAPATVSQISKITQLKQDKEKAEDSYNAICDSLDVVLNTMDGMSSSLSKAADGLDELNEARAAVSAEKSSVESSAKNAAYSLSAFADELQPLISGISDANDALSAVQPELDTLSSDSTAVSADLETARSSIAAVQKDMEKIAALSGEASSASAGAKQVIASSQLDLASLSADLKTLRTALGTLQATLDAISVNLPSASDSQLFQKLTESSQPVSGFLTKLRNVEAAHKQYESLLQSQPALSGLTFKDFLVKYSDLSKLSAADAQMQAGEAAVLWDLAQEFDGTASLENVLSEAEKLYNTNIPALTEQSQTVAALHDTVYPAFLKKAGKTEQEITFKQFLTTYLSAAAGKTNLTEAEADKAVDFWNLMQNCGGTARFQELLSRASAIYKDDLGLDQLEQANTVYASYQTALQQNPSLTLAQFLQLAAQQKGASLSTEQAEAEAKAVSELLALEKKMAADSDSQNSLESYLSQIQSVIDAAKTDASDVDKRVSEAETAISAMKTAIDSVLAGLGGMTASLSGTSSAAGITGDLQNLNTLMSAVLATLDSHSGAAASSAAKLGDLTKAASGTLADLEAILKDFQSLETAAKQTVPAVNEALSGAQTALGGAAAAAKGAGDAVSSLESLAETAGDKLDSGSEKTLASVAETLRGAASGLSETDKLRTAKETITSLIESEWNAHTGGDDNLLNMDPNASPVSMTSAKNASPQSLQFILRTQEIKTSSASTEKSSQTAASDSSFWSRVGGMFTGIWNGLCSLFHH